MRRPARGATFCRDSADEDQLPLLRYKVQIHLLAWSVETQLPEADLNQVNMTHWCMEMVLMVAEP